MTYLIERKISERAGRSGLRGRLKAPACRAARSLMRGPKRPGTEDSMTDAEKTEKKRAYQREYYQKHREECLARSKKWREENPDKVAASRKRYKKKHKKQETAAHKRWYENNKGKQAEYMARYWSKKAAELNGQAPPAPDTPPAPPDTGKE